MTSKIPPYGGQSPKALPVEEVSGFPPEADQEKETKKL